MRTRTLAVVGLALLLTLSGCSALTGSGGDDGLGSVSYPDGTGPDGFSNATAVLAGHQDRLSEDSYRIAFNVTYARPGEVRNTTTLVSSNEAQERHRLVSDL
jgi:hypothetical protein